MLVARAASRNTDRAPETELQLVVVLGWGWGGPATCQGRARPGAARGAQSSARSRTRRTCLMWYTGLFSACGVEGTNERSPFRNARI